MSRPLRSALAFAALLAGLVSVPPADAAGRAPLPDPRVAQGEYVFRAAGCYGCHTDAKSGGRPLAGGRALVTPFGTFYSPNITPDAETGIGRWREQDFVRALRDGLNPAGEHYYPAFPYAAYTRLSDADLRALWAYLRVQPPVRHANRPHALAWYLPGRWAVMGWKYLYFTAGAFQPDRTRSPRWNRGAYLVEAAAHCGECHTPRNWLGGLDPDLRHAGTRAGPEDGVVPNITPDRQTGIGRWRAGELVTYLETGLRPDGDSAGGSMAEVIDNGLRYLHKDDLAAIAEYVLSLPAVANAVRKPKAVGTKKDPFE